MEEGLDSGDIMSSLRMSIGIGSSSRRSWAATSVPEVWSNRREEDDEEELKWAAIQRLPTFERLRKSIVKQVLESGRFNYEEVDISKLGMQQKKRFLDGMLRTVEEDNERFLSRMRERIDRLLFLAFSDPIIFWKHKIFLCSVPPSENGKIYYTMALVFDMTAFCF